LLAHAIKYGISDCEHLSSFANLVNRKPRARSYKPGDKTEGTNKQQLYGLVRVSSIVQTKSARGGLNSKLL
jgi:hypothetical protein